MGNLYKAKRELEVGLVGNELDLMATTQSLTGKDRMEL